MRLPQLGMSQQMGGQMLPEGGDTGAGTLPRASCFQDPYEAGPLCADEEAGSKLLGSPGSYALVYAGPQGSPAAC